MDNSLIILFVIIIIIILCTFFNKTENFENEKTYQIVGVDDQTINKDDINFNEQMILNNKTVSNKNTGEKIITNILSTTVLPNDIGKVQYNGKNYKGILIYVVTEGRDPVYFITFDVNSQPIS
jgi:uncharacterized protein YxeA